jgi:hypothetical protein
LATVGNLPHIREYGPQEIRKLECLLYWAQNHCSEQP